MVSIDGRTGGGVGLRMQQEAREEAVGGDGSMCAVWMYVGVSSGFSPALKPPRSPTNRVTLMEKGPTGKLVGTDYNGNRYFEDNSTHYSACV